MPQFTIDVWSDIACPWCYIGKRHLEAALRDFEPKGDVVLRWRSFELDASAPRERDPSQSHVARLAAKYRCEVAEAQQMIDRVTAAAAEVGIAMRFDRARSGNTFDAHRLVHFAAAAGRGDAMKERLLRAYFCDGLPVFDREALAKLAGEIGLDGKAAATALASDAFATDVRGDEEEAMRLRIQSVPFFVFAGRQGLAGAHPPAVILEVMRETYGELGELG